MNILELAPIIPDTNKTIDFLRTHHLLSNTELCCNTPMYEMPYHCSDGNIFRCHTCWGCRSIRHSSLFENSNKPLCTLLIILFLFCNDVSPKQADNQLKGKISYRILLDWYTYCRDICTRHILNNFPWLGRSRNNCG